MTESISSSVSSAAPLTATPQCPVRRARPSWRHVLCCSVATFVLGGGLGAWGSKQLSTGPDKDAAYRNTARQVLAEADSEGTPHGERTWILTTNLVHDGYLLNERQAAEMSVRGIAFASNGLHNLTHPDMHPFRLTWKLNRLTGPWQQPVSFLTCDTEAFTGTGSDFYQRARQEWEGTSRGFAGTQVPELGNRLLDLLEEVHLAASRNSNLNEVTIHQACPNAAAYLREFYWMDFQSGDGAVRRLHITLGAGCPEYEIGVGVQHTLIAGDGSLCRLLFDFRYVSPTIKS